MPANTSPDNIVYPVSTDPVAPLETVFANMANSVQDALDGFRTDFDDFTAERAIQTFRWADSAARSAQTGMVAGDIGYQVDTKVTYRYTGTAWLSGEPFCVLGKTTSQNLTTSLAALTWDVEISDSFGMHDNAVNNTRIIAAVPGFYLFAVTIYNNNTSGTGVLQARKNGSTDIQGSFTRRDGTGNAAIPLDMTFPVSLNAGDYVEIMVSHSTAAGTIGGGTGASGATVTARWMG